PTDESCELGRNPRMQNAMQDSSIIKAPFLKCHVNAASSRLPYAMDAYNLKNRFRYRTSAIFRGILSHDMQPKIYGLWLDRMDRLVDTGYFDVNSDIMNRFDERRGDIQEKIEVLTLLGRRAKHEEQRNVVIVVRGIGDYFE
ncbi:3184_t:CDS:2, partial [Ambispora gerdemannii]